jgi:hypothetical protein
MNTVNRRGVLRLIGGAPIMARRVVEKLSGVSVVGVGFESVTPDPGDSIGQEVAGVAPLKGRLLAQFLKRIGLPGWKKRQIRTYARATRILDPDIASLHSVSTSMKLHMQWKRNERKQEENILGWIVDREDQEAFYKLHNVSYF